jgi:peroxiredoxin
MGLAYALRRSACFLLALPLAFVVVYLATLALEERVGPLPRAHERKNAGNFVLHTLDEKEWALSAERGKVVVLNFWGTSCPPCLREIPALTRIANRFHARGVRVVGICTDKDEDDPYAARMIRDVIERFHIPYLVLRYDNIRERSTQLPVVVDSVPITVIIDGCGRVARTYYGAATELLLQRDIEQLLGEL